MKHYLHTQDHFLTKERFVLLYDETFQMLITDPQPKNLESYYNSAAYRSHNDSKKGFVNSLYAWAQNWNLKYKFKMLPMPEGGHNTLLDIGAGMGHFMHFATKRGWQVTGVEPNETAKKYALEKHLTIYDSLEVLPNKKYKVITLWHVLEHLPDVVGQFQKIYDLLDTNGTLIIAVPNFKSFDAKYYKQYWAAYDVPRHLYHFSKDTFKLLAAKHQLQLIACKPLWLDAFYVALLSEQYKNNANNYLKAFFVGLWSNINALKTREFSSQIYILRPKN